MPSIRWVIFGAVYAENLGDGVIAECLRHGLTSADPNCSVHFVDISARQHFGDSKIANKSRLLKILQTLPPFVRKFVSAVGVILFLLKNAYPRWRKIFRSEDVLIIGGGHLFSDYNLNFPLKIALIDRIARTASIRSTIYAVGVSKDWSTVALKLFKAVAARAAETGIAVRDEESADFFKGHIPDLASTVKIARDPGLLAREVYEQCPCHGKGVGINLSDPTELSQYSERSMAANDFTTMWKGVIQTLLAQGRNVTIFTNGAKEDQVYLEQVVLELGDFAHHNNLQILERPITPDQLVSQIKGLEIIVGHRLHAHIVAFSHNIPGIGLEWDTKLRSFFRVAGIEEQMIAQTEINSSEILRKIGNIRNFPPKLSNKSAELHNEAKIDIKNMVLRVQDWAV